MPAATLRRISMKALARYQIILLGEQRHIRCEQLAQGCCPNSAAAGVEPATSRSRVQCSNHYTTEPQLTLWMLQAHKMKKTIYDIDLSKADVQTIGEVRLSL